MRLARVVAGLLTSVAVLAGCSSEKPASQTLPSPVPTSAEATPTLAPLGPADMPMPALAMQKTPEGFTEFTRYYLSLINRLTDNLDGRYLRQLSHDCGTCERLATDADSDARKGYRYQGGSITIMPAAPAAVTDDRAEIAFTAHQDAYSVVDSAGQPVPGLSSGSLSNLAAGMAATWVTDHWLVTNLSFG